MAAALVLLITFGSITATVIPLLVAVLSLVILTGSVALVSHAITTAQFALYRVKLTVIHYAFSDRLTTVYASHLTIEAK